MTEPGPPTPTTLRWAIALLWGESAAVAALTGLVVFEAVTARVVIWRNALLVIAFAAVIAVLLGLFAWALGRRRGWARAPAAVLQLMLLPIGWYMVQGAGPWLGLPVFALGVVGTVLLLAPATRTALGVK